MNAEEFTPARKVGLMLFQELYGDQWIARIFEFNQGRPDQRGMHLIPLIRQIRNRVTANPIELPDLRR